MIAGLDLSHRCSFRAKSSAGLNKAPYVYLLNKTVTWHSAQNDAELDSSLPCYFSDILCLMSLIQVAPTLCPLQKHHDEMYASVDAPVACLLLWSQWIGLGVSTGPQTHQLEIFPGRVETECRKELLTRGDGRMCGIRGSAFLHPVGIQASVEANKVGPRKKQR